MPDYNRAEKVRIIESENNSEEIYIIKDVKKVRKGGVLYLLKPLEDDSVLRICYENNESLLERVS
ncbi:MAG: hypothetical protein D4R72_03345 [Nitrosopumilales archaeon]|nr:MAG: hypothetical protein D4R72_03345 [Nitrosopumilales archaeon]